MMLSMLLGCWTKPGPPLALPRPAPEYSQQHISIRSPTGVQWNDQLRVSTWIALLCERDTNHCQVEILVDVDNTSTETLRIVPPATSSQHGWLEVGSEELHLTVQNVADQGDSAYLLPPTDQVTSSAESMVIAPESLVIPPGSLVTIGVPMSWLLSRGRHGCYDDGPLKTLAAVYGYADVLKSLQVSVHVVRPDGTSVVPAIEFEVPSGYYRCQPGETSEQPDNTTLEPALP